MQKLLLSSFIVICCSVVVGAVIFLRQAPDNQVQAALEISCSTGFDRPLLFGIGHAFSPSSLQTIPETGGTFVTQSVAWDNYEKRKGEVDEAGYRSFNLWKDRAPNLVILGNISGTPDWAKDIPTLSSSKAQPRRNDPEVEARFRNFVFNVVSRNKDKVKYWSYWNEPNGCQSNHHTGSCAWDDNTADSYVHWLNIFYEEVKKADPSALVVGGELEMVKNIDSYVKAMNDRNAKYDILGVHPYDKGGDTAFPLSWVKSAYETQRLQNGKRPPIFVTEWGWDLSWSGVDEASISRRLRETYEIFKQNPWILAAQYHAIRDVGDGRNYGLRDSDSIRAHGAEFLKISQEMCGQVSIGSGGNPTTSPSPSPTDITPACITTTNDLGGTKLKKSQPVTITSVANVPINTFRYIFYIPVPGSPTSRPYCIAGLPAEAGFNCPAGSGPLIIESKGNNEGAVQAMDWIKYPNGQVQQSIWKGNIGSNRKVPYDANFGGTVDVTWNFSNYANKLNIGGPYSPTAEVDAMATYSTNNKTVTMEIWRNNQMWYNIAPFTASGDNIDWGKAEGWKMYNDFNTEEGKNLWPGTGLVTARSSFVGKDNKLWHIYWRGNEEWVRGVPIVNGNPNSAALDKEPNKGFVRTRTLSELHEATKTSGNVQAISHMVMPNGDIQEQLWINYQVRKRTIPNANGPDFAKASSYQILSSGGLTPTTDQSDSITIDYDNVFKNDIQLGDVPDALQVNATFTTVSGDKIDNHRDCVTWFSFDKAIPGDFNGDCLVDIYDYNILIENQGKTNCQYNIIGDCKIDNNDIVHFMPLYGNTCPAK